MDELRPKVAEEHASPHAADPDPSLDYVAAERARLEAEIAAAKARTAAAKERAASRELELRAALHTELVTSRESLAELERQHEVAIAMVRSAAKAEVERILADARRQWGFTVPPVRPEAE
jgi:L-rhamnose isomerase